MKFPEGSHQPGLNHSEYRAPSEVRENPKGVRMSKLIRDAGGVVAVAALLGIMGTDKASAAPNAIELSCPPTPRTSLMRVEVMDAVIPEPIKLVYGEEYVDLGQGKDKKNKPSLYPLNPRSAHPNEKK